MVRRGKNILRGYDLDDPKQKAALTEKVMAEVQGGASLKAALGLSQNDLEQVYAAAYGKYQQGRYIDAIQLFRYLVSLDPETYKYVLGLAASHHKQHQYLPASNFYLLAILRRPDDPIPYFHSADCYLHLKDNEMARLSLQLCITHCGEKPDAVAMKTRAEMILASIEGKEIALPKKEKQKKAKT